MSDEIQRALVWRKQQIGRDEIIDAVAPYLSLPQLLAGRDVIQGGQHVRARRPHDTILPVRIVPQPGLHHWQRGGPAGQGAGLRPQAQGSKSRQNQGSALGGPDEGQQVPTGSLISSAASQMPNPQQAANTH